MLPSFRKYNNTKSFKLFNNYVVNKQNTGYFKLFKGDVEILDYFENIILFPDGKSFIAIGQNDIGNVKYNYNDLNGRYEPEYKSDKYIFLSFKFNFLLKYSKSSDGEFHIYNYITNQFGVYETDMVGKFQDFVFHDNKIIFFDFNSQFKYLYDREINTFFKTIIHDEVIDNKHLSVKCNKLRDVEIYMSLRKGNKNIINDLTPNVLLENHLRYKGKIYKRITTEKKDIMLIVCNNNEIVLIDIMKNDVLFKGSSIMQLKPGEITIVRRNKKNNSMCILLPDSIRIYDDYDNYINRKAPTDNIKLR